MLGFSSLHLFIMPAFFSSHFCPSLLSSCLYNRQFHWEKLFFSRAATASRIHRRPPKPLGSSRAPLEALFLELKIFLAGRRLVKSSWQQSIQSLPSSVVSNVPSALLTLGERVFLLVCATLFFFFVPGWAEWPLKESPLFLRLLSIGERQEMSLLCRIN